MASMEKTPTGRALQRVNVPLLLWAVGLIAYGTLVVWSATSGSAAGTALFKRHLVGLAIGLVPLGVFWAIDYKTFRHWLGPLAFAGAALLTAVLLPGLGIVVNGQRNWLALGPIRLFQPSEPAKLLLIIVLAGVIAQFKGRIETRAQVGRVLAFVAVPLGLIMLEPDLGTGLVFIAITMGMLLVGGLKPRWFLAFAVAGLLLFGAVWNTGVLKQYQKDRLTVFLDQSVDRKGAGYNLAQSKIAIGSGGLTGKGLRAGTQSSLHFIPERHTDFIFSVLGEELGFLGALMLLGLYLALLITALEISASSRDLFGALIVAGLISMWTFQILVNIGMTVGIMPITGIPLPFMSFGSSFMVTNLAGVGMQLSVWARRYGT
jgi:rod shape determining protein RodA